VTRQKGADRIERFEDSFNVLYGCIWKDIGV
jgi:hypothetical protein